MQRYVNTFATPNGRPVVGGSVYIYAYPGSSLATLYSDDGVTETANPVLTDENGLFSFYAADGRYSMYLTSSGTVPLMLTDSILLEDPQDANAIVASNLTVDGISVLAANSASPALKITQTGTGVALLVEDSASPDSSPMAILADGTLVLGGSASVAGSGGLVGLAQVAGNSSMDAFSADAFGRVFEFQKSRNSSRGSHTVVQSGDTLGNFIFSGSDGAAFIRSAQIVAQVDGTPGTNDMPGRIVLSTTADGASSPTERLRIDSSGNIGVGGTATAGRTLELLKPITGATVGIGARSAGQIQSDVTSEARYYATSASTQAASYTVALLTHYYATQGTFGAGSTVSDQRGFFVTAAMIGGTNNYGFYGDIPAAAGRYNLYMNGTASNFFAGDMQLGKTVTPGGTTGAQTINKTIGTVNFAAAASSLVVTNSLVTANSIILCTIGTADATMKSVVAVAAAGSFTITANAAATAETRVNFAVFN